MRNKQPHKIFKLLIEMFQNIINTQSLQNIRFLVKLQLSDKLVTIQNTQKERGKKKKKL